MKNTHALAWFALLPLFTVYVHGQDLLVNGGFELDDGGHPAFWEQRTPTDGSRVLTWDKGVFRSGMRSLKIENKQALTSRWRTGHLRCFQLKPGSGATVSGWVRTASIVGSAHLRLYCLDRTGQIVSQPGSSAATGTADWRRVVLKHRIPEKTAYVMVYAEINGKGTAWFDDLQVEGELAKPTSTGRPFFTYPAKEWDLVEGFRLTKRLGKDVVELPQNTETGKAQVVFWGDTARYDMAVTYVDENDGVSHVELLVNDKVVGELDFDQNPTGSKRESVLKNQIIRGVDVQTRSRITIRGRAGTGERCRVYALALTAADRFQGELLPTDALKLPPSLLVYENPAERRALHGLLGKRGMAARARLGTARTAELAGLKTPAEWQARQRRTRARLKEFFGDYGPKCPLNPQITGRIDRPGYTIDKVIFESQPRYFCTANLYIPKGRKGRLPGVIFVCGHAHDGKASQLYHECCLGLVLKGYVVLALDPMGQGERSEYVDPDTQKDVVRRTVPQHHYLGRPSWLVNRSLAGYRTWDCIRAVDYLVSRPEVDPTKLAAVGNSGGGQMSLLITAADERIDVCVAAHPGGSQENTYLKGQSLIDRDVLSLIPPRPCAFVVGEKSGEIGYHKPKYQDMLRFYRGLGVGEERAAFVPVDGIHNMKQPKREASYAWVNRWFGKEAEGSVEPRLVPESVEALHCTEKGSTVMSLASETGQTLNAKVGDRIRPKRPMPADLGALAKQAQALRGRIKARIGLDLPAKRSVPQTMRMGECQAKGYKATKFLLQAEPDIALTALLLRPDKAREDLPIVLHVSQNGKPTLPEADDLALQLVRQGVTVLSLDVRGAGESDPRQGQRMESLTRYVPLQWRVDAAAICLTYADTTPLALRTLDVVRGIDYLRSLDATRPIVLVGEELGGLWAMMAGAMDPRVAGVVCVRALPSYKLILRSQYYEVRDYFWTAGALVDFDICDLPALIAPRPMAVLAPLDAKLRALPVDQARTWFEWAEAAYDLHGAKPSFSVQERASAKEVLPFLRAIAGK